MMGGMLGAVLAGVLAAGQPPDTAEILAFCELTRAAADQEALRLMTPEAFATFGWLHQPESVFGDVVGDRLNPRLLAGLGYSFGGLNRGVKTRALADAECARYRLLGRLYELLNGDGRALAWRATRARLAVLEESLPRAAELLEAARAKARDGRATTTEVAVLAVRVDGLRAYAAETRRDAESIDPPTAALAGAGALLASRDREEEKVARAAARLRNADAWDLEVRGGYDRVWNVDQRVPLYGLVTFRVSLGLPWQLAAGNRAVRADRRWAELQGEGVHVRVDQVLRQLRATRRAERVRLKETALLLSDLEERLRSVERAAPDRADRFLDVVWFEAARAAAEHAYLKAHVEDLDAFLGPEQP